MRSMYSSSSLFQAVLGGKLRVLAVGSAPLCSDTFDFMMACFEPHLMRGYGLTETTSGVTVTEYSDSLRGSVGSPMEGVFIRIVDWEEGGYTVRDRPYPRGELIVGGSTVTRGTLLLHFHHNFTQRQFRGVKLQLKLIIPIQITNFKEYVLFFNIFTLLMILD